MVTQKRIAKVFDVQVPAISKHLKKIFEENELDKNSVVSKMEITVNSIKVFLRLRLTGLFSQYQTPVKVLKNKHS